MNPRIPSLLAESIAVKQAMLEDENLLQTLQAVADLFCRTFERGGKVLFCGNGGSAADAQHIAAELSGRFYFNRPPLYAEALHVNTSFLTAVANDFGYEQVYARMVEAAGRPGDVLVAITTSGNSPNVLAAAEMARSLDMHVVGMTGAGGGKLAACCEYLVAIPSTDTPRIQEAHITIGHLWCELVEKTLFDEN